MDDYYEIDFLKVESQGSGDAITIRYSVNGQQSVHVVDGGYLDTGRDVVGHLQKFYGSNVVIDNVVLTHGDQDHAGGLRHVLNTLPVRRLWMHRPWLYSQELLPFFPGYQTSASLANKFREIYSNIDAVEKVAISRNIPINDPFQGSYIGEFLVTHPTKDQYLYLLRRSNKTPASRLETATGLRAVLKIVEERTRKIVKLIAAGWGDEKFSSDETSAENEMSVVQYAEIAGRKILLTGDVGREGLRETARFLTSIGVALQEFWVFQVPHHGSRKNVSTDTLDALLGPRLAAPLPKGQERFCAIISCSDSDGDHPRNAVIRAMVHRGGHWSTTETKSICAACNIHREGYSSIESGDYPGTQEA